MEELNKNKKVGWFKTGNVFIDDYARHIGYTASIVYVCLKRHMNNKTRLAFPSEDIIAEKLGMNRRTVIRAIEKLESQKFITIEKTRYKGRWQHNNYYLTFSKDWLCQPCDKNVNNHETKKSYLCGKNNKNHVDKSHINNTNINYTNIKRIGEIINFNKNSP